MNKISLIIALTFLVGCGDKVYTPDNKPFIDQNTARIELLEANDALQDVRLDLLESATADLDSRLSQAEDDIDTNEVDIADLFDEVEGLDEELSELRSTLRYHVRKLRQADRKTRRIIRKQVRKFRSKLAKEVRRRQLADSYLQNQIDELESDLGLFEARQALVNRLLTGGLLFMNYRISVLESRVQRDIARLDRRMSAVESDVRSINREISRIRSNIRSITSQIEDVESRLLSVVYPCGEGNSEEVLLDTQDGLVAYFQSTRNETVRFHDTVTTDSYQIPGHYDKYCKDTNFFNGECNKFDYRFIQGSTVPSRTYRVNDSDSFRVIDKAYLDVLDDGNYRTTDGFSCNFTIANGEVQ